MLESWLPNVINIKDIIIQAVIDTLIMLCIAGIISFMLGMFLGVILVVTKKGGILENRVIYNILDKTINLFRSIPFIILISGLTGFSILLVGTAIGVVGALPAIVLGCIPFFAKQIETALYEVDAGIIEASQAMGLSSVAIIFRVYIKESIPAIVRGTVITFISLLGLIAMAGAVGAGGIGNVAILYGHNRNMQDVSIVAILIILVIVSLIQGIGNLIIHFTIRRKIK